MPPLEAVTTPCTENTSKNHYRHYQLRQGNLCSIRDTEMLSERSHRHYDLQLVTLEPGRTQSKGGSRPHV